MDEISNRIVRFWSEGEGVGLGWEEIGQLTIQEIVTPTGLGVRSLLHHFADFREESLKSCFHKNSST